MTCGGKGRDQSARTRRALILVRSIPIGGLIGTNRERIRRGEGLIGLGLRRARENNDEQARWSRSRRRMILGGSHDLGEARSTRSGRPEGQDTRGAGRLTAQRKDARQSRRRVQGNRTGHNHRGSGRLPGEPGGPVARTKLEPLERGEVIGIFDIVELVRASGEDLEPIAVEGSSQDARERRLGRASLNPPGVRRADLDHRSFEERDRPGDARRQDQAED